MFYEVLEISEKKFTIPYVLELYFLTLDIRARGPRNARKSNSQNNEVDPTKVWAKLLFSELNVA